MTTTATPTVTARILAEAEAIRARNKQDRYGLTRLSIDSACGSLCYSTIHADMLIESAAYALVAAERAEAGEGGVTT